MATAYTGPKLPGLTNGGKLAHGYRPLNLTLLVFFRVLLPNKRAEKTSGRPIPQALFTVIRIGDEQAPFFIPPTAIFYLLRRDTPAILEEIGNFA